MLVREINKQFKVPLKVLCKRFGIARASVYRNGKDKDTELKERIIAIASRYTAWGYRMILAELKKQGFRINHKKLYRLYRSLRLQKPPVISRKRHTKVTQPFEATQPEFPCHVWAVDFLHDRTTTGKTFRIFNVLDVFSRRGFEPVVEYSLPGRYIAQYLDSLCRLYGPPRVLRRDDGPEFRSSEFQRVIRRWRIREEVIPPGQPFNNGHIESYHGTMRDELLQREEFETLKEAQQKIKEWVRRYNTERPHSSLGYRTPQEVWDEYYRN